jgi:hypothetical protein
MAAIMINLNDNLSNIFFFCEGKDKVNFFSTAKSIREELHDRIPTMDAIMQNVKYEFEKKKMEKEMENFLPNLVENINADTVYHIVDNSFSIINHTDEHDMMFVANEYLDTHVLSFDEIAHKYINTYFNHLPVYDMQVMYYDLSFQYMSADTSLIEAITKIVKRKEEEEGYNYSEMEENEEEFLDEYFDQFRIEPDFYLDIHTEDDYYQEVEEEENYPSQDNYTEFNYQDV